MPIIVSQAVVPQMYSPGKSDDGSEYVAEIYTLVREFEDGTRFTHVDTFPGAERWDDREGSWGYTDVRDEALEAAHAHLIYVKDKHEGWIESEPAYGSQAYMRLKAF